MPMDHGLHYSSVYCAEHQYGACVQSILLPDANYHCIPELYSNVPNWMRHECDYRHWEGKLDAP